MNLLDIDKRGNFQLYFSQEHEQLLHSLPTCRYRPGSQSMSLQPQVEVWKSLKPHVESGLVETSQEADEVMSRLKEAYLDHRIRIKSAAIQFKGETVDYIPVPLKSTPYVHQVRAFGFASRVDASALLMEQGTGKTLVAIAVAAQRFLWGQVKRVLIVCPKSVIPVWPKELRKHLSLEYKWDRVPKTAKTALRVPTSEGLEFLIINYDKLKGRFKEIKKWKPDMVILDESHRIGSKKSNRSRQCHKLGDDAVFKLILTGTVLGQSLVSAWSQYRFINPNVFGHSFGNFKEQYCKMGGFQGYQIVGYKNLDEFSEKLHSVAFRTTKKECLDLPEETSQNLYCEPSAETKRIYQELDLDFSTTIEGEEVDVELAITKLMKLRQIVGGLVKHDDGRLLSVSREKLSMLEELLVDKNWDNKLVIAVSFTHEVELISELCDKLKLGYITLTGKTSEDERFSIEDRFRKDSSCDILLLQVDTGGEGLDFTPADMMVFYSPTFSFIKVSQVKARIHRIGQDKPVTYLFFVMEGTVDEDIVSFLEEHGDLTELILEKLRPYKLTSGETMNDDRELKQALKKISNEIESKGLNKSPKPSRKKKMTKTKEKVEKKTPAKKTAAKKVPAKKTEKTPATKAGYTAGMMAEELGIAPADLRKHLRSSGAEKPEGGWKWNSKKAASETLKLVKEAMKGSTKSKPAKEKASKPAKEKAKKPANKAKAKKEKGSKEKKKSTKKK